MADGNTKPDSKSLPNFYSAAGDMYGDGAKPPGGETSPPASPGGAASTGEKIKNVTALLEVVKKIDQMETDPANKEITQQMVTLVEQYMTKLQPQSSPAAGGAGMTDAGAGAGAGAGAAGGTPPAPPM